MAKKKTKTVWYPLDNAAKIYPPTANEKRPHVFSFSAFLYYPVEPTVLQHAARNVVNSNPTFKTKLMRGKFWYYLEENNAELKVFQEGGYYLKTIDYKRNNGYLFEVLYSDYKITVNFFHVLTDGTGGFNFFSQILLEYFKIMNYQIDSEGLIRSVDKPFFFEEGDDSFLLYDKKTPTSVDKEKKPFKLGGSSFDYDGVGIITAKLPINQIKDLAKKYSATITSFLGGLYIWTIYNAYLKNKPVKNKKISLLIPCNLRKKYGGETMRNFTMYARVSNDFSSNEYTLEECVKLTEEQVKSQLTTENLDKIIHYNVKSEKNPIIKIVPLVIKDLILKLTYSNVGENLQTGLFSNLGLVNLPKSFNKYLKHLTFAIAPTFSSRQQTTAIGYNDNLYLTFTRDYVENYVEKDFFKALSGMGVDVTLYSNFWESEL